MSALHDMWSPYLPLMAPLARYLWFKVLRTLIILSGAQASKLGTRLMVNGSYSYSHNNSECA